jgi:hypothetical protein
MYSVPSASVSTQARIPGSASHAAAAHSRRRCCGIRAGTNRRRLMASCRSVAGTNRWRSSTPAMTKRVTCIWTLTIEHRDSVRSGSAVDQQDQRRLLAPQVDTPPLDQTIRVSSHTSCSSCRRVRSYRPFAFNSAIPSAAPHAVTTLHCTALLCRRAGVPLTGAQRSTTSPYSPSSTTRMPLFAASPNGTLHTLDQLQLHAMRYEGSATTAAHQEHSNKTSPAIASILAYAFTRDSMSL